MAAARRSPAEQEVTRRPAREGAGSKTVSVSLPVPLAARTAQAARRTRSPVSHVVASALELYTALPPATLRRVTDLQARLGRARFADALSAAVDHAIEQLEWDAAADDMSLDLAARLPGPALSAER